jgi:hypothetical protein
MKNQYFCVIYVECIFFMRERYDICSFLIAVNEKDDIKNLFLFDSESRNVFTY